jgi:hypothetical protein
VPADLGGRVPVFDAVVLGAPHRIRVDVAADDIEPVAQHMAGKLQPHGAEPDHAGTPDLIWLIHD